jgi:hypothetical protein
MARDVDGVRRGVVCAWMVLLSQSQSESISPLANQNQAARRPIMAGAGSLTGRAEAGVGWEGAASNAERARNWNRGRKEPASEGSLGCGNDAVSDYAPLSIHCRPQLVPSVCHRSVASGS